MFTQQTGVVDQSGLRYPQILMRGKECVNVPFKLQSFLMKNSLSESKLSPNTYAKEQTYSVVEKNFNQKFSPKEITVC